VVYVRVNDRLPKSSKRSIDLALIAAKKLDFVRSGLTQVTIDVVAENEVPEEFRSPIEMKVKSKKK
jgi:rare lipoprotein A